MFKELLIGLQLSDSDIETAVQNWGTIEDNPLVYNAVSEAMINGMNKPVEGEEEE